MRNQKLSVDARYRNTFLAVIGALLETGVEEVLQQIFILRQVDKGENRAVLPLGCCRLSLTIIAISVVLDEGADLEHDQTQGATRRTEMRRHSMSKCAQTRDAARDSAAGPSQAK